MKAPLGHSGSVTEAGTLKLAQITFTLTSRLLTEQRKGILVSVRIRPWVFWPLPEYGPFVSAFNFATEDDSQRKSVVLCSHSALSHLMLTGIKMLETGLYS